MHSLAELIVKAGFTNDLFFAKRWIMQGAVILNGIRVTDNNQDAKIHPSLMYTIQINKTKSPVTICLKENGNEKSEEERWLARRVPGYITSAR